MMKISVLIPTYNRSFYLCHAIKSILEQSIDDYEIIVVDDGSTDETRQTVRQYGDSVRYYYQPNQGVSVARNRAFKESSGQYIAFLDSDDWLLPNALQTLWATASANPAVDVIYGDAILTDDAGNHLCKLSEYQRRPVGDSVADFGVHRGLGILSTLIKRQALLWIDGPFDEQMVGYEDKDLFFRLKERGAAFAYVPEPVCCYRFHGGNKSAPKSEWAERRRLSLLRYKLKVLESPSFLSFSIEDQYSFFRELLVGTLKGDYQYQETILAHQRFQLLPPDKQAKILYYLSVENLLTDAPLKRELERLGTVIRLRPLDIRPYIWMSVATVSRRLYRRIVNWRRRAGQESSDADPVMDVLRSKGVA